MPQAYTATTDDIGRAIADALDDARLVEVQRQNQNGFSYIMTIDVTDPSNLRICCENEPGSFRVSIIKED